MVSTKSYITSWDTIDEGGIGIQREKPDAMVTACKGTGLTFKWAFDGTGTAHARQIITKTGWKISLDRGFDILQKYPARELMRWMPPPDGIECAKVVLLEPR